MLWALGWLGAREGWLWAVRAWECLFRPGLVPGSGLRFLQWTRGAPACLAACGCGQSGYRASRELGHWGTLSRVCREGTGVAECGARCALLLNWTYPMAFPCPWIPTESTIRDQPRDRDGDTEGPERQGQSILKGQGEKTGSHRQ